MCQEDAPQEHSHSHEKPKAMRDVSMAVQGRYQHARYPLVTLVLKALSVSRLASELLGG